MQKLIKNNWMREPGSAYERATILRHDTHPEGLDIARLRFMRSGPFSPDPHVGHIISVLKGSGVLRVADEPRPLHVEEGVHIYLPPHKKADLAAEPGTELVQVSAPNGSQARGNRLLVRDETFIHACATGNQSLRWALTPQYLSRRIFLHHDPVLLSKSGNPVSWYRTTMFDVDGLPKNQDGEPVFKMSYNSRTECNVCYDVRGTARVRMALHPYDGAKQLWGPWHPLDGDSTYHLNEASGSAEEESLTDEKTGAQMYLRNKHEVHIADGHVTLFCIFDPAPTGVENHRPGEYSDYEPLSQVIGTELYKNHQREIARYDEMVDKLSLAKATGDLASFSGTAVWTQYERGRDAQAAIEAKLAASLSADGKGRGRVLAPWMMQPVSA